MSIFDTLLGKDSADASRDAARDTYNKQVEASQVSRNVGNQYQQNMYGLSERFDPYRQSGNAALQKLMQGLGLGGAEGSAQFAEGYQNLPGYQSGLDTGSKAVTQHLNAGPGIQSGAAMKALQRYGSDYENQRSGDYLNRLMAVGQQGLGATQMGVNTAGQGYGGQLQGGLQSAQQLYGGAGTTGQGDIAAAQARSQGLSNTIDLGMKGISMLMGMPSGGMGGGGGGGFGSSFTGNTSNPFAGASGATTSFQGGVPYPMFG